MKTGQEIWWIETINVKVGIVKLINEIEQTVTVETSEGERVMSPKDSLVFASITKKGT